MQGKGHSSSPFFSIWFAHLGTNAATDAAYTALSKQQRPGVGSGVGGVRVVRDVAGLQESQAVPTWKRPNPRQRKKLRATKGG